MQRLLTFLAISFTLALAGCLGNDEASHPTDDVALDAEPGSNATAAPPESVLVAERDVPTGGIAEADFLCVSGGTDFYDLPQPNPIPAATTLLRFEVQSGPTTTGVQAGYETADGITWLDVVSNGQSTFLWEVPPGIDLDALSFKYQLNTPAQQDCYTGASVGDYSIKVFAET